MGAADRLDQIEARANAATEGPWYWRNTGPVYLQGARTRIVMAFERMGMNGAQPVLRDPDGFLRKAGRDDLHAHPDTAFIAASRQDVPDLVAALRAVLALHRPSTVASGQGAECYEDYPCSTVRAIDAALGGA